MAKSSPEYRSWQGMKARCLNPNGTSYSYYGGRGIRVCERWLESFEDFFADMGPRPGPEYSIDRINNDGNYEPGNCRWATRSEQQLNRRPRPKKAIPQRFKRYEVFFSDIEHEVIQRLMAIHGVTSVNNLARRLFGLSTVQRGAPKIRGNK